MTTDLDSLAMGVADSVWNYTETDFVSKEALHEEIMGLIFQVTVEALAADSANLVWWQHELPLNPWSVLVCHYEKVADAPATFKISYEDGDGDFIMLREWREIRSDWAEG